MKGTVFIKDKKVILCIGEPGKIPEMSIDLLAPQFIFDGDKVTVIEGVLDTIKK